jgi:hypothetical protein
VIFTADAERDRAFFRNVLEFPSVDAGGGWLIFALRPRSWRPVLPKRAASTSSGRRTKRDGMYTRRGRKTGDPDPRASRAPTCFLPDGLEAIPPEPEALATLDRLPMASSAAPIIGIGVRELQERISGSSPSHPTEETQE